MAACLTGFDARALIESLAGQTIATVTSRPNTVVRVEGDNVVVVTNRSPEGKQVPIEWLQDGLDRAAEDKRDRSQRALVAPP
jgi:hypothetical protein